MPWDVFVSHSSIDKPVADATVAVLERRGLRCWVAPRDIAPGADWGTSIMNAIHEARAMVIIFSAHSNASEHVKREVERAIASKIPVIPLRIENIMPSGAMEFFLSTPHWMDALTPPMEAHLERLAVALQNLLAGAVKPLPPLPPPPPIKLLVALGALALLSLLAFFPLRSYLQSALATVDPKLVGAWRTRPADPIATGGVQHHLRIHSNEAWEMHTDYHAEGKLENFNLGQWGFEERNGRIVCKFDGQGRLITSTVFLLNGLGNVSHLMPTGKMTTFDNSASEGYRMSWSRKSGAAGVCAAAWSGEREWGGIHWALTLRIEPDARFLIDGNTQMSGTITAKNTTYHLTAKQTGGSLDGSYELRGDRLYLVSFFYVPGEFFPDDSPSVSAGFPFGEAIQNLRKKIRGE